VKSLPAKNELEKFEFLRKLALDLGALDAKVIPTSKIVVEDRVVLKCKVGCNNYGKTLACPPHVPTAEEFRKIVAEYKYAIFMKFNTNVEADAELKNYLAMTESEVAAVSKEVLPKWKKFWADWNTHKKDLLNITLKVEKEAMSKGYPLAFGMVSGMCHVCEECTGVKTGICLHPTLRRYSEEAVGVNVQATAKKSGLKMTFPWPKTPESFAMVLID
jgi:predicted metal-binding protein